MSTEEKKSDLAALALSTCSGLAGCHSVRSVANLDKHTQEINQPLIAVTCTHALCILDWTSLLGAMEFFCLAN